MSKWRSDNFFYFRSRVLTPHLLNRVLQTRLLLLVEVGRGVLIAARHVFLNCTSPGLEFFCLAQSNGGAGALDVELLHEGVGLSHVDSSATGQFDLFAALNQAI